MKQRYLDEIKSTQNKTSLSLKKNERHIEKPNIFYNNQDEFDVLDARSEHKLFTLMSRKNFRMKA